MYRGVAEAVGRVLGCEVEFVIGRSFEQFALREIDLGFICGLPYVRLSARPDPVHALVAPVVRGPRYDGRPIYFSDVIVRTDDPRRSFEELDGADWCFNDVDSHSGYGVVLYHLAQMNRTPAYFGRFEPTGAHLDSIRAVAEGRFDASAIDSHVLDVVRRDDPALVSLVKVISTIGPSPIQPLVAGDHVPVELREDIRDAVTGLHDDREAQPALAHGLVDRFVGVDDASYDAIRSMIAAASKAIA